MKKFLFLFAFTTVLQVSISQDKFFPSFEDILSLTSVSNAIISPDGKNIVFQKQTVDWENNRYDRELWISKNGESPFQLTNSPKVNSTSPKWSPDGKWIAFISSRNDNAEIFVIRTAGGEALQLTHSKNGVNSYKWSPDGSQIAFVQPEDLSKTNKKKEEKFGGFAIEDQEYGMNQIWLQDFKPEMLSYAPRPDELKDSTYKELLEAKLLLDSIAFSVNSFEWSPDGRYIAIEHQPDPLRNSFFKADISIYNTETKNLELLVNNESYDGFVDWSPDSKSILYESSLDNTTSNYYLNGNLFRIDIDGSNSQQLGSEIDEDLSALKWEKTGIYGIIWQKTKRKMIQINPTNGKSEILDLDLARIANYSISEDEKKIAYTGANDDDIIEVYLDDLPFKNPRKITSSSSQIEDWAVSSSEVISWTSEDGTTIEGVLHKPENYDPSRTYPLLVIIHGGPTGISVPGPVPSYVYPTVQWLNKGALVLMPNYRGSAGYGEKFRSLNVRNLGVGDAWDVLSGVKYLEDKGIIDGNKVGSMGWSQGGYISAFLTTNSNKFKAISVGAGISNWMTYYVNTDIHPFTRQYLKATPWSDKEIYENTSPMTNINNASTPTLIQHGEFDRRVPPANAYELFQGLQDVGVETKLIIYKGFGHGITKPKERLAAVWHNWQWFGKYIWDEEIEIPIE